MKRAFTIVELLIYMGLLAGIITILGGVLSQVIDVQLESQAVSSVEQDGRFILARLNYDLHRAASVTTPASPGQATTTLATNIGTYALSGDNLQLAGQNLNSYDSAVTAFSVTRIGFVGGLHSFQINLNLTSRTTPLSGSVKTKSYVTTITMRD